VSRLFFPDNTVLVNFALINRVDLLATLLRDKGAWCASVAGECAKSANVPELAQLGQVQASSGCRCTLR
jgi:hypothetical protein